MGNSFKVKMRAHRQPVYAGEIVPCGVLRRCCGAAEAVNVRERADARQKYRHLRRGPPRLSSRLGSTRDASMPRKLFPEEKVHPAAREQIASYRQDIVAEVEAAVAANEIVVVGMRQNPFPKKARQLLDAAGLSYQYLEYGSYFKEYRRRLALKLWTGWPTFPMVFVKGVLIGGADDLARLIQSGELPRKK
jgi:monothiol glutaredoxin